VEFVPQLLLKCKLLICISTSLTYMPLLGWQSAGEGAGLSLFMCGWIV
jgi:hypothetical protein